MTQARQWLRDELAADREAIAAKSATDWVVTIVDVVVAPLLVVRAAVASWIWAINHGTEAELGLSIAEPAITARAWARIDALQVAALLVIAPAFVAESPACCATVPSGVAAYVGLQGVGVAVEGVVSVAGVRR